MLVCMPAVKPTTPFMHVYIKVLSQVCSGHPWRSGKPHNLCRRLQCYAANDLSFRHWNADIKAIAGCAEYKAMTRVSLGSFKKPPKIAPLPARGAFNTGIVGLRCSHAGQVETVKLTARNDPTNYRVSLDQGWEGINGRLACAANGGWSAFRCRSRTTIPIEMAIRQAPLVVLRFSPTLFVSSSHRDLRLSSARWTLPNMQESNGHLIK